MSRADVGSFFLKSASGCAALSGPYEKILGPDSKVQMLVTDSLNPRLLPGGNLEQLWRQQKEGWSIPQ